MDATEHVKNDSVGNMGPSPAAPSISASQFKEMEGPTTSILPSVDAEEHEGGHGTREDLPPRSKTQGIGKASGDRGKKRKRKGDMGRAEWSRHQIDKRSRNAEEEAKRLNLSPEEQKKGKQYPVFSAEEIQSEERKPKRKVAVLIGYLGSGYLGMQLCDDGRSIEGDLFNAFVAAGAISKANANDPKKSSLIRCARTDKGVHAAGNIVSLKLIVDDPDIVPKINAALSPQIRVWGILRTTGGFSCYQLCDSRIYEYLIPTYALLPPHPRSHLGKKLVELAEEAGDLEGYHRRQAEVLNFWSDTDDALITPLLASLSPDLREKILSSLYDSTPLTRSERHPKKPDIPSTDPPEDPSEPLPSSAEPALLRTIRATTTRAKRAYRLPPARLARLRATLDQFVGTHNFHNYTVQKSWKDPSAMRIIKSFTTSEPFTRSLPSTDTPTDAATDATSTEWLSLRVHGQSFMMHQIRKMVSLAVLAVRCGAPPSLIPSTFTPVALSIPKAPGLGLLLQQPVFDTYNAQHAKQYDKEPIDFSKYRTEMEAFREREIYGRIWREEEGKGVFGQFFATVDAQRDGWYWWVGSKGVDAATKRTGKTGWGKDRDGESGGDSDDEEEIRRAKGLEEG